MKIIIKSDGKRKPHFARIVKTPSLAQEYGKFIDFAMKVYMATANSRRRICWGYSFFIQIKIAKILKKRKRNDCISKILVFVKAANLENVQKIMDYIGKKFYNIADFWCQGIFMSYLYLDYKEVHLLNTVRRREVKYLLNQQEFRKKKVYLEKILKGDEHNSTDGYVVRSLYFDTLDDRDFREKEHGVEIRRKVRLRIYDPNADFAMLEMKQKQGDYQMKRSLLVSRTDAIEMTKGNYASLLSYKEPFAFEMYTFMTMNFYRPKVVIQYKRDAFIVKENSTRLTFDHDIVATESSFDIFDPNLKMTPVLDLANVVLEVKYNGFLLSYVRELIADVACVSTSVSKYYLSRNVSHKVML